MNDTLWTRAHGAYTLTATVEHDSDSAAPWDREDGHGPVSDWRKATRYDSGKRPGELVLCSVRNRARFYDYAEACKIARRDGWGAPMYSQTVEHGANGLRRLCSTWFVGRDIHTHETYWTDELDSGDYAAAHTAMRATYPSARAYASAAARADYERLRDWCNDEWHYVGVCVSVTHTETGVTLCDKYSAALWGIESDDTDGIAAYAEELAQQAIEIADAARDAMVE